MTCIQHRTLSRHFPLRRLWHSSNPLCYSFVPSLCATMSEKAYPLPRITISLAINPPSFVFGEIPTISITATSHATRPITIFTWPTIFRLDLAQDRKNFTCDDLTTDTPVFVELTKGPRRPGFTCTKGSNDDKYFWTLEPETPLTFKNPFRVAFEGRAAVAEGHQYRYAVNQGKVVRHWWYGRRDDVMSPSRFGERTALSKSSGEPIVLEPVGPVKFEVRHRDATLPSTPLPPWIEIHPRSLFHRSGLRA